MGMLFGGMGHCTTRLQILKDMLRLASYEYLYLFPSKVLNTDTGAFYDTSVHVAIVHDGHIGITGWPP